MSETAFHLFSMFPIQENIAKYLDEKDLKNLSSLGGVFQNFHFDFCRELDVDYYELGRCSKFRKIEKLKIRDSIQKFIVPECVLSVLVSLEVPSIDKQTIDLSKCKRLETLSLKNLRNLCNKDFPLTLKKLELRECDYYISKLRIKHLINLKEIDCSTSSITNAAVNNFPISLERINLAECSKLSNFNIKHLINLKEIDCTDSTITDVAVNNFPVSLEKISLFGCPRISKFNISHLVNLKEINCAYSTVEDEAINRFPVSLEKIDISDCDSTFFRFNISHLVNLKKIDCADSNIEDEVINNFPISLQEMSLRGCEFISDYDMSHLINLDYMRCSFPIPDDWYDL
uniref:Uncharacterized protein n=1 Tax=Cacopsylla melanoneura TaxID=428564 RepID=A0A8D8SKU5_9HEMI